MKRLFIAFAFTLMGAFAFASPGDMTVAETTTAAMQEKKDFDKPEACWIISITVSCGGTYNTQYCDEGLHGSLGDWIMQVDSWACDQ